MDLLGNLRAFASVAEHGSLTRSAASIGVAPSALSRQIAGLEAQLGAPLFERHPRGMVLTEAGEILARHARRAQLDAEHALGEIGALRGLRKLLNEARGEDGLLAQGVDLADLVGLIEHEFATVLDPPRTT